MCNPPAAINQVLRPFERAFSERVREWAKTLVIGAILAPGQRTMPDLRIMSLYGERQVQNYHRVRNPAVVEPHRQSDPAAPAGAHPCRGERAGGGRLG